MTPFTVWRAPSGAAVVSMPGQIDRSNRARMHMALARAAESGASVIIADLTKTGFCGHAATVTPVGAQARPAKAGTKLRVAAAVPNAEVIAQIAGDGHRLDFYPDLTAALAGPRSRGTHLRHDHHWLPAQAHDGRGRGLRPEAGSQALAVLPARHHAPSPRLPRNPA